VWAFRKFSREPAGCEPFNGFVAATAPEPVRSQGAGANSDKMFHRDGAPKAGLRRSTLWNWQSRHGNQIAAVEIVVQKPEAAGVIFADEYQSRAVELHIVEKPSLHRRQIGHGLDVVIATTSEQPHLPAAALFAKDKDPVGFDHGGESLLLAYAAPYKLSAMLPCQAGITLTNPNARLS